MKINNFCISGASISRCPWITWIDFISEALDVSNITNYSCKGAGNDYILTSGIHAVKDKDFPFLAVMLTNFDKFDMWVANEKCQALKNEKHPPHWIDGTLAVDKGFWCTGSHFPLSKELYKNEFFDLGHNATINMQQILALSKYCEYHQIPGLILFDSPVLTISETQINKICKTSSAWIEDLDLTQVDTTNPLIAIIEDIVVDTRGLIGFCVDNDLPWYNNKYGPHPPSDSHLAYYQTVIKPWLENKFPGLLLKDISSEFVKLSLWMTKKWKNQSF
jgi:hypothetical protein